MQDGIECLREWLQRDGIRSPLTRLIDFDFYDGPMSGAAWSEPCSMDLRFDLLDSDAMRNLRIYSLSVLPSGSFGLLAEACANTEDGEPPGPWTEWCPMWNFDSAAIRLQTEQTVATILARSAAPSFVLGTLYLLDTIIAVREVSGELSQRITDMLEPRGGLRPREPAIGTEAESLPDWFAFLGLDREAYLHMYDDDESEGKDPPR